MLGDPKTLEVQALRVASQIERIRERLCDALPLENRREVEDG